MLTKKDLTNNDGRGLLYLHNGSPLAVLRSTFPERQWLEWRMVQASKGFWNDPSNVSAYMHWLGERLGYTEPEDWYKLIVKDLQNNDGGRLLSLHNNSPLQLLHYAFPERQWLEWRMVQAPRGYWNDPSNVSAYMHWLGERLGYREPEDWYKLTTWDLDSNDGRGLLCLHNGSPLALLRAAFPERQWLEWRMSKAPKGFWSKHSNVSAYMHSLGERLGYTVPEDWYKLTKKDMEDKNGSGLLCLHNNSPLAVLRSTFPEHQWLEWRMVQAPRGYWNDPSNVSAYMHWLGERLGYTEPEDWYKLTTWDLDNNNGHGLLCLHNGSPLALLRVAFPERQWLLSSFQRVGYSAVAIKWLEARAARDGIHIQHAENGGEVAIPGTLFKPDGFCKETATMYEFLGSFFHGDPNLYEAGNINPMLGKPYGQLFSDTMFRLGAIAARGYRVIFVWESDFKNGELASGILQGAPVCCASE